MPRPPRPLLAFAFVIATLTLSLRVHATEYPNDDIPYYLNLTRAEFYRDFFTSFATFALPLLFLAFAFRYTLSRIRAYKQKPAKAVSATTAYAVIIGFAFSILLPSFSDTRRPSHLGGLHGSLFGTALGLAILIMPLTPFILSRSIQLLRSLHPSRANKRGFEPILPQQPAAPTHNTP